MQHRTLVQRTTTLTCDQMSVGEALEAVHHALVRADHELQLVFVKELHDDVRPVRRRALSTSHCTQRISALHCGPAGMAWHGMRYGAFTATVSASAHRHCEAKSKGVQVRCTLCFDKYSRVLQGTQGYELAKEYSLFRQVL